MCCLLGNGFFLPMATSVFACLSRLSFLIQKYANYVSNMIFHWFANYLFCYFCSMYMALQRFALAWSPTEDILLFSKTRYSYELHPYIAEGCSFLYFAGGVVIFVIYSFHPFSIHIQCSINFRYRFCSW